MFRHLVLGLLRDGQPRHGYELTTEYGRRSAISVNTGNFYRELQKLAAEALVTTRENPPEADARRIPYQITEQGRREFDEWLTSPCQDQADLSERLLFIDLVPPDARARIFEWWEEELWMRSKALARAREEALRLGDSSARLDPLPLLLLRRMKLIAAELEFIKEFRTEYEAWQRRQESRARAAPERPSANRRGRGPGRR
jgi:DNA-binding PadR family transcriptional regulator